MRTKPDECGEKLPKITDTASFVARGKEMHGDRYDYSQTEYVNTRTPVTIICRTCGPFVLADPSSHVRRFLCGCRSCNQSQAKSRTRSGKCSGCGKQGVLKRGKCSNCIDIAERPSCRRCGGTMLHGGRLCNNCRRDEKLSRKTFREHPWGKWSGSSRTKLNQKATKAMRLGRDQWTRWSVNKAATIGRRVNVIVTGKQRRTMATSPVNWIEWRDKPLRKEEDEWTKKCRSWARSLATRQASRDGRKFYHSSSRSDLDVR